MNNAYDNKSSLRLDRSLLEEVQVISGTFDAEYGQAMSGVVNAVLRRAPSSSSGTARVYGGRLRLPGPSDSPDRRLVRARPRIQSYQASA